MRVCDAHTHKGTWEHAEDMAKRMMSSSPDKPNPMVPRLYVWVDTQTYSRLHTYTHHISAGVSCECCDDSRDEEYAYTNVYRESVQRWREPCATRQGQPQKESGKKMRGKWLRGGGTCSNCLLLICLGSSLVSLFTVSVMCI